MTHITRPSSLLTLKRPQPVSPQPKSLVPPAPRLSSFSYTMVTSQNSGYRSEAEAPSCSGGWVSGSSKPRSKAGTAGAVGTQVWGDRPKAGRGEEAMKLLAPEKCEADLRTACPWHTPAQAPGPEKSRLARRADPESGGPRSLSSRVFELQAPCALTPPP